MSKYRPCNLVFDYECERNSFLRNAGTYTKSHPQNCNLDANQYKKRPHVITLCLCLNWISNCLQDEWKFCFYTLIFHLIPLRFCLRGGIDSICNKTTNGGWQAVRVVGFCLHTRLCRVNIFVEPRVRLQTMIFNTAVPLTGVHFMKMVTKKAFNTCLTRFGVSAYTKYYHCEDRHLYHKPLSIDWYREIFTVIFWGKIS